MIPTAYIVAFISLVIGTNAPAPPEIDVFIRGQEAAVLSLLAPDNLDTFSCNSWTLASVVPGPDCAVRFHLVGPEGGAAVVRLDADMTATAEEGPAWIAACVQTRTAENGGQDFFEDKCITALEAQPPEDRGSGGMVRLAILALAALFALGLLGVGRKRARGSCSRRDTEQPSRTSGYFVLVVWVAPALVLRGWLMAVLPPGAYELENFGTGELFRELLGQTGALGGWLDAIPGAFHPPLLGAILDPWLLLGDQLGVGGTLWWLRLPNLGLTVLGIGLLARLGALLGSRTAGPVAAALFAWLPATVLLTVFQGHYLTEMVLSLWFIERLVTWVRLERPVFISLTLAAALTLWAGHLAALIVGPGFLLCLALCLRRGRSREALAALLLLTALYLPIAESGVRGAAGYTAASSSASLAPEVAASMTALDGHRDLPVTTPSVLDALALPVHLPLRLFGLLGGIMAFGAMTLLAFKRPRLVLFPGVCLTLYILARALLSTRWENLSPLVPICLMGTALGLELVLERVGLSAQRRALIAAFVAVSILGGGWAAWRSADGAGITELFAGLHHDGPESALAARMMEEDLEDLPILLLAPADRFAYHICPSSETLAGVRACTLAADAPVSDQGIQRYSLDDRSVVVVEGAEDPDRPVCPNLDDLLGAPPLQGVFLAVLADSSPLIAADSPCTQRFPAENCVRLFHAPRRLLVLCGSGEATP